MSKYPDIYISLCGFTKYFLSEVIPKSEPTDLMREATKELLFAVIEYAESIKCDIKPVLVNYENGLVKGKTSSPGKSVSNCSNASSTYLFREQFEEFLESEKKAIENNKPTTDILLENSLVESSDNHDVEPALEVCCHNSLADPTSKEIVGSCSSASIKEQCESSDFNEEGSPTDQNDFTQNKSNSGKANPFECQEQFLLSEDMDDDLNFFSECFLKKVLLKDSINILLKDNGLMKSTSPVPSFSHESDIPQELIELNKCLSTKLLSSAYYCWKCGYVVVHRTILEEHLVQHNAKAQNSGINYILLDICKECSFAVVGPADLRNTLLDYHSENHRSPFCSSFPRSRKPSFVPLANDGHYLFIKNALTVKYLEKSYFPTFFGICLPCHASFSSPLEWNCHIYEFEHFLINGECITRCNSCNLVILGLQEDLYKNDYLKLKLHTTNCCSKNV